jgi:hypothetical protein
MRVKDRCWLLAAFVLSMGTAELSAQATLPAPPSTVELALHTMSDAAGVIFTGEVVRVLRAGGEDGSLGSVEIEFQVENAVRGCTSGDHYVLREWAGLWGAAEVRYRVGQRMLMLLRTPGPSGYSSPVGGMDGAIPLRGVASDLAGGSLVSGASAAPAVEMVDLRWVGAQVVRPAAPLTGDVSAASVDVGAGSTGSIATQGASVDAVLGMLGAWERVRIAAR